MTLAASGGSTQGLIPQCERLARVLLGAIRGGGLGAQAGRLFLWTPVAFGCGAAVYATMPVEPPLWALAAIALAATAAAVLATRGRSSVAEAAVLLLACAALGVLAGGVRTGIIDAPIIGDLSGPPLVEGWVVDVDSPGAAGPRLVLAPTWIEGVAPEALPARIRVGIGDGGLYGPGASLRLRALLNPPPPPASPGGYDFARDAYFKRIGGSGYAVGAPEVVTLVPPAWSTRAAIGINAVRWALALRILDRMGSDTGGIAVAMITGHEAWIDPDDLAAMRDSGLAHVLSI